MPLARGPRRLKCDGDRPGDPYYSTLSYQIVARYYSIHEWVKFPTFDTPETPKPHWR